MLAVSNLCKNTTYLVLQARFKAKVHWAKLRKKTGPKHKALSHFDEFYGSVFGTQWDPMREALLRKSKYVAVVNNYGDSEQTMEYLTNRGAHCLKNLIGIQQEFHNKYRPTPTPDSQSSYNSLDRLQEYSSTIQEQEISEIYSGGEMPEKLEAPGVTLHSRGVEEKQNKQLSESRRAPTLEQAIAESKIDESRIIDTSGGLTSESLYQFVPATKLKGMEEWIPESQHYSYYSKGQDFPLTVEPETEFVFPEHLKVFIYEKDSDYSDFPEPRRCSTGVYNYYPMDCGSVLAVLALCLRPSDRVLDLCAAPGGKSLVALQTLLPDVVVCNDISLSRSNRIQRIFRDYFIDFAGSPKWRERVKLSMVDGRYYTDDQRFDKVLVDVPCTTDRHSVKEDDNNMFRPDRVKERLKIPEMQSALLANALRLVKVGGAVVYSTCSFSPIQNDGVVHMALKSVFETDGIVANVRDLSAPFLGFTSSLQLGAGASAARYGQLVVPSVGANYGPSYMARLLRVK